MGRCSFFFFSSRRRHTRFKCDWSSDVCSSDLQWLAYVTWSSAGGDIWKVRASGGEPQKLTSVSAFYSDVVWAPDSARIVALRRSAYDRENSEFDFRQTPGTELTWLPAEAWAAHLI